MVEMEKFEKILELLEKKSLTESETKMLNDFADSDEEIKSFIGVYKSLNALSLQHLPTDLLSLTFYLKWEMNLITN